MKGTPIILNSVDDGGRPLVRVEVTKKDVKDESWLQHLIFTHPEVLPVSELDESFTPLIPIGREVSTNIGYIDNLYISPVGRLSIVETKLWKSPEKHRTVVAQILDYAKEVSEWDYSQLNEAVLKSSRTDVVSEKKSLDQVVSPHLSDAGLTLTEFQDRTIANLRAGEFLLLIVGDRISANVALLGEAIRGVPGLDFRLGLVELQIYPLGADGDWPILVVPDIVGRTVEVTRGVIKVQYAQEKPTVEVEISEEEPVPGSRTQTTPEVFLQKAPPDLRPVYEQWLKGGAKGRAYVRWRTVGFSLRVKIDEVAKTIFDAYPEWAISLIRESDAAKLGATTEQYQSYLEVISPVPVAVNILTAGKQYVPHESLTSEDLAVILNAATEFAQSLLK